MGVLVASLAAASTASAVSGALTATSQLPTLLREVPAGSGSTATVSLSSRSLPQEEQGNEAVGMVERVRRVYCRHVQASRGCSEPPQLRLAAVRHHVDTRLTGAGGGPNAVPPQAPQPVDNYASLASPSQVPGTLTQPSPAPAPAPVQPSPAPVQPATVPVRQPQAAPVPATPAQAQPTPAAAARPPSTPASPSAATPYPYPSPPANDNGGDDGSGSDSDSDSDNDSPSAGLPATSGPVAAVVATSEVCLLHDEWKHYVQANEEALKEYNMPSSRRDSFIKSIKDLTTKVGGYHCFRDQAEFDYMGELVAAAFSSVSAAQMTERFVEAQRMAPRAVGRGHNAGRGGGVPPPVATPDGRAPGSGSGALRAVSGRGTCGARAAACDAGSWRYGCTSRSQCCCPSFCVGYFDLTFRYLRIAQSTRRRSTSSCCLSSFC